MVRAGLVPPMPNRILRASILDSDPVNRLSLGAEVFYRRLMSVVDDFGRFDGRPAILRASLYPLRLDAVRESDILGWMKECQVVGLLIVYQVDNKPYLIFPKLHKHLTGPRAKESKYPDPPKDLAFQPEVQTDGLVAYTCESLRASARRCAGSASDTDTDTDTKTDSADPDPSVGQIHVTQDFDPLKHDQDQKKRFVSLWHAAGLKPIARLTASLQGLLNSCLADPWWAEHYPAALARAGGIDFLRSGVGRRHGPLDPFEFLRDPDLARRVLDGCFDPRPVGGAPPPAADPVESARRSRAAVEKVNSGPPAGPMRSARRTPGEEVSGVEA